MGIAKQLLSPAVTAILAALWCGVPYVNSAESPAPQFVSSDLADRIVEATQDWGELGIDTAVKPAQAPAMSLRIKDKDYQHGLGHHANGQILLELAGQFQTFQTEVGVQWQGGQNTATVIFRILADGKPVFDSGVMREGDAPRPVDLPVAGVSELTLISNDAGDGISCDCGNWVEARLMPAPTATPATAPQPGLDIAPFGCVATWDPQRMQGTAAQRVEEFPAEDVRLHPEVLPESDGTYRVPTYGEAGCIGLQWEENRILRQAALVFADAASVPPVETIQLQTWSGESAWQGSWVTADVTPQQIDHRLIWSLQPQRAARGTQKLRWVFALADLTTSPVLQSLQAYSRSRWATLDVRLESTPSAATDRVNLELYNGLFVGASEEAQGYQRVWDRTRPVTLKVRYAVTPRYKADRTMLRFDVPDRPFGVAIEDLVATDCVYVPHAGLFVTREPAPVTLPQYLQQIASQKTLLAQVREKPDQTFAQALAAVHNPVQDLGPTMLSLACDNRKFVVERAGRLLFDTYSKFDDPERPLPKQWQLIPRFGRGVDQKLTRKLTKEHLPMLLTTVTEGEVTYRQRTHVAPLDDAAPPDCPAWVREQAVGVVQYLVRNQGQQANEATMTLAVGPGEGNSPQVTWQQCSQGIAARLDDRLLVWLDVSKLSPLQVRIDAATVTISGMLPPSGKAVCYACVPAWSATEADGVRLSESLPLELQGESYWHDVLEPGMVFVLPDELLARVILASEQHCLMAARNEDGGRRVSPWISSDRYGPLESEANSIVRGMGMLGHDEFAQRSLDYFIARYNPAGYLTTGYTMVGTGEHLWTLAEHYERTQDDAWLKTIAPEVARVCKWIVAQRAKTKRVDSRGQPVPEYGLFPPGVTADWNRYAYRFFNDAQYCAGLTSAAQLLAQAGHPDAAALLEDARQYRADLLRAYRSTQARAPVVRLEDGTWVPADPALLDCPGRVEDFLPGEDGNRSWAYSVEIGAHHLAATGILDPSAPDVGSMLDYLEESQFLRSGMGDYPEQKNRQDVFNLGGFAKVQPYYGRFAEVYAARNDVRPFIRSYFNAIPSLVSLENLSFWEHFHNIGGWNKTHETGWFLCQSRIMFVMERGDELWLAPFVTSEWFHDEMVVGVGDAPTRFGRMSYEIRSAVAQSLIEAWIWPPKRTPPRQIILRVRHPEGNPMKTVYVNDRPHSEFDPLQETVTLSPSAEVLYVRVLY